MAANGTSANGGDRLEEAMAVLIQNQATLVGQLSESERHQLEFQRRHVEYERETAERFARIEAQTSEIIRILTDHNRQLERLTEAVRDRISFKGAT